MSDRPNDTRRPSFPDARRRRGNRRPDDSPPGICRVCRDAPALPDDVTCAACGDQAIERAREGVEVWLHMHAERVRELERDERERERANSA